MALKPHGFIPVVHAATKDRPDEIDTLISAEAVAAALAELGFVTEVVAVDLDLNHFHALKRRDPLLVFNLVDAVRETAGLRRSSRRCWMRSASLYGRPFRRLARDPVQGRDQAEARASRPTDARLLGGRSRARSERASSSRRCGSMALGLDQSSVVKGADVARVIDDRNARFGTEHFAERYIEGREFNLALLEERGRPACCRWRRSCSRIGTRAPLASSATTPSGLATARPISARHGALGWRRPSLPLRAT